MTAPFFLANDPPRDVVPHVAVMRHPEAPPPSDAELDEALAPLNADEVMVIAHHSLAKPAQLAACYRAIALFWPGFFDSFLDFEQKLRDSQREAALPYARLVLVPIPKKALDEGGTYLAASLGETGLVAEVVKGTAAGRARASKFQLLFRIDARKP